MQNQQRPPAPRARAARAVPARRNEPQSIPAAPATASASSASASTAGVPSGKMASIALASVSSAIVPRARYQRQDLYAIAELAYHYLSSGGVDVAGCLVEGLVQIAPEEAYFALMFGLIEDKRGNAENADQWYAKAAQLDPREPRADLNRAELRIERKDYKNASALLVRAVKKAAARNDAELEQKATALLERISNRGLR